MRDLFQLHQWMSCASPVELKPLTGLNLCISCTAVSPFSSHSQPFRSIGGDVVIMSYGQSSLSLQGRRVRLSNFQRSALTLDQGYQLVLHERFLAWIISVG